jgi:hypothetical protein
VRNELLRCLGGHRTFIASARRLDEVCETDDIQEWVVLVVLGGASERFSIVAETKLEDGKSVVDEREHPALTLLGGEASDGCGFCARLDLATFPGKDHHVERVRRSSDCSHNLGSLGEVCSGVAKGAADQIRHGQEQEPDRKGDQRALVAGAAFQPGSQLVECRIVTDRPGSPASDPEPLQDVG